jgi:hypothetical protein
MIIVSEQKRFTLRMDADLFKTIEKRADESKRSIAKEIEYLLENYLKCEESTDKNSEK